MMHVTNSIKDALHSEGVGANVQVPAGSSNKSKKRFDNEKAIIVNKLAVFIENKGRIQGAGNNGLNRAAVKATGFTICG